MDQEKPHVLLCIGCRQRITREELQTGRHDHVDLEERIKYDRAANTTGD